LQAVFNEFFYARQLFFSQLSYIFSERLPPFIEISIEILCLLVFPLELLELQTIFSEFHRIHLGEGMTGEKEKAA